MLGRTLVNDGTLRIILTEIETTFNDRLITYLVTEIRDPEPLTPTHLLYGRRLRCVPYLRDDKYN